MDIKAYESRKIVLDMLQKRNYDVDKYRNYNLGEIRIMFGDDELDIIVEKNLSYLLENILLSKNPPCAPTSNATNFSSPSNFEIKLLWFSFLWVSERNLLN